MHFLLPGSVVEEKPPGRDSSIDSRSSGSVLDAGSLARSASQKAPLLHTSIWEQVAGTWTVTHQFSTGLELERHSPRSQHQTQSRVHLPWTSLQSLQLLRSTLRRRGTIVLDVPVVGTERQHVYDLLLQQLSDSVSAEASVEAMLKLRPSMLPKQQAGAQAQVENDMDLHSVSSEELIQPEMGSEEVDISICLLRSFTAAEPAVALARLSVASDFGGQQRTPVRYMMLVLCSSTGSEASQAACEVGRAFATAVMDEDFAATLQSAPPGDAGCILAGLDAYLSNVTIVPTVYVQPAPADVPESAALEQSECLLSDSIVDGIEKLICKSRDLPQPDVEGVKHHHHQVPGKKHPPERRRCFFVEVNMKGPTSKWHVTRRLMQGLELDATTQMARPHLPHVSVHALARVRKLMTPESVGLGLVINNAQEAMQAIVHQLSLTGLPLLVADELTDALASLVAADGTESSTTSAKDLGSAVSERLLEPSGSEEACHVLAIVCEHFPPGHAPVAAFLRMQSPLGIRLPSTSVLARFFMVFAGPESAARELAAVSDSLAALLTDEDLMGDLAAVGDAAAFVGALDARLDSLTIVPHTRVCARLDQEKRPASAEGPSAPEEAERPARRLGPLLRAALCAAQRYSLPLVLGVFIALLWSNVDMRGYRSFTQGALFEGAALLGHDLTLQFLVNDVFMCFFFGLAIKEVTEALLPGGSLSPLSRAVNPLVATLGGIAGPAAVYAAAVLALQAAGSFDGTRCSSAAAAGGHRRLGADVDAAIGSSPCSLSVLLRGWGVPTATDISLAWMFAISIFGAGHPAINFLLLLAIVDDAIGMAIIAIFYSDPLHPVKPLWLLLVLAAALLSLGLRKLQVPCWQAYIALAGPVSWLGLLKAHVHPALALVAVVPLMPASHAAASQGDLCDLGACDLGPRSRAEEAAQHLNASQEHKRSSAELAAKLLAMHHADEAPLHVFEHTMKLPVDLGMFFFGLANAGARLDMVGGVTAAVVISLLIGKTLGITLFGLLAVQLGFGLPNGVTVLDLVAMSAVAGVGLTMALFMANEAFADPGLQGQAKVGAVLSVTAGGLAWAIKALPPRLCPGRLQEVVSLKGALSPTPGMAARAGLGTSEDWIEECMVDDILHIVWLQRRYAARCTTFTMHSNAKTPTHSEAGGRTASKCSALP